MVRQATETAVSASISTPVGPVTFTLARTRQPGSFALGSISTVTFDSARGWQSGISSAVRLAAMMPAIRATPSTSPFLACPLRIASSVSCCISTATRAVAVRAVSALADTSTMTARPCASKCVSSGIEQLARRCAEVGLFQQALAHQEAPRPMLAQPDDVLVRADPALGDQEPVGRDQRRELGRRLQ